LFLNYFKITPYLYYTYKYNDPFLIKKRLFDNQSIIIFDVGAHDGRSIDLYKKKFSNSTIFSFEPTPKTFSILKKNTENLEKVNLYNEALTFFVGQTSFYINNSSLTNSLLESSISDDNFIDATRTKEKITVNTNTIDNFCSKNTIDKINILKIDAQGADLDVLKGAIGMLKNKSVDLIYIEVEFVQLYENQPLFHDISHFLSEYGYNLYSLYNLSIGKNGQMIYGDAIFLPNKS
jgi:FkbM family methyltransferase